MQNYSGYQFGQYELRGILGEGGMGTVYLAYQANLRREVAIKLLPSRLATEAQYIERFTREAQMAASLEHAHIVPVYDYGTQEETSYIVMRYLKGGTLDDRMRASQANNQLPSLGEVADLMQKIAGALNYAHMRGVIHRDIKASNIMFDDTGTPYITDFGIARALEGSTALTATGMTVGTPTYMSPELWQGGNVTAASDQYALAVLAYYLMTGTHPYEAPTPYALMNKHITEPPPPVTRSGVPDAVQEVFLTALAKEPLNRYEDAEAFAVALREAVTGAEGRSTGFAKRKVSGGKVRKITGSGSVSGLGSGSLAPPPATRRGEAGGGSGRFVWMGIAGILIVGVLLIAYALLSDGGFTQNAIRTQVAIEEQQTAFAQTQAFVIAAQATDTPLPDTATPRPTAVPPTDVPPTDTNVPPTDIPPTATDVPPTATDVPPTATDIPPTNTPLSVAQVQTDNEDEPTNTPPPTNTPIPPTATPAPTDTPVPTNTNVPPTATDIPPTNTPVPSATDVPPTWTPVPPTATLIPTWTPVPPTATLIPTWTPVPPTATLVPTNTDIPPTATLIPTWTPVPTDTPVMPTDTPVPPTATLLPTNTVPPPTATPIIVALAEGAPDASVAAAGVTEIREVLAEEGDVLAFELDGELFSFEATAAMRGVPSSAVETEAGDLTLRYAAPAQGIYQLEITSSTGGAYNLVVNNYPAVQPFTQVRTLASLQDGAYFQNFDVDEVDLDALPEPESGPIVVTDDGYVLLNGAAVEDFLLNMTLLQGASCGVAFYADTTSEVRVGVDEAGLINVSQNVSVILEASHLIADGATERSLILVNEGGALTLFLDGLFAGRIEDLDVEAGELRLVALDGPCEVADVWALNLGDELVPAGAVLAYSSQAVNVRRGDGTNFPVVGSLQPGDPAVVTGVASTGSGWYRIELSDGRIGWVAPSVVRVEGDESTLLAFDPPPPPVQPTSPPVQQVAATAAPAATAAGGAQPTTAPAGGGDPTPVPGDGDETVVEATVDPYGCSTLVALEPSGSLVQGTNTFYWSPVSGTVDSYWVSVFNERGEQIGIRNAGLNTSTRIDLNFDGDDGFTMSWQVTAQSGADIVCGSAFKQVTRGF
jgi:hypothetical protein